MKKLITILLILPFLACSDSDNEPSQDYTSFTFEHHEPTTLQGCVVAFLNEDNNYIKIEELGDLTQNNASKEVTVNNQITKVYLFTINTRLDATYVLKQKKKNVIIIDKFTKGIPIVDKSDSTQYPQ